MTTTAALSLRERAFVIDLTIRRWEAETTNRKVTAEVAAQHGSKADMGRYQQARFPKHWLAPIRAYEMRMRDTLKFYTAPWGTGTRIGQTENLFTIQDVLSSMKDRYLELVNDFIAHYDDAKAEAKQDLNGLYDESAYPPVSELPSKFGCKWVVKPIPDAEDFRIDLNAADLDRLRAEYQADLISSTQAATLDTVEKIADVVKTMTATLKRFQPATNGSKAEGIFRDSLVGNVAKLIEVLPGLNFTADPRLDDVITHLDELTAYDADALRANPAARVEVVQAADDILKKLKEFYA